MNKFIDNWILLTTIKQIKTPLFSQTIVKLSKILNKLETHDVIADRQLQFVLIAINSSTRRFYVPRKIRKAVTILTVTNKMLLPKRPIISDCNSEFEKVTDFIDNFWIHRQRNTLLILERTYSFETLDTCWLITLNVYGIYTNIDCAKRLCPVWVRWVFSRSFKWRYKATR